MGSARRRSRERMQERRAGPPSAPVAPSSPLSPLGPSGPSGPSGPRAPSAPRGPSTPANADARAVRSGYAKCSRGPLRKGCFRGISRTANEVKQWYRSHRRGALALPGIQGNPRAGTGRRQAARPEAPVSPLGPGSPASPLGPAGSSAATQRPAAPMSKEGWKMWIRVIGL
jgi:hypothetical protein